MKLKGAIRNFSPLESAAGLIKQESLRKIIDALTLSLSLAVYNPDGNSTGRRRRLEHVDEIKP